VFAKTSSRSAKDAAPTKARLRALYTANLAGKSDSNSKASKTFWM
jgi:hypothetical protein